MIPHFITLNSGKTYPMLAHTLLEAVEGAEMAEKGIIGDCLGDIFTSVVTMHEIILN